VVLMVAKRVAVGVEMEVERVEMMVAAGSSAATEVVVSDAVRQRRAGRRE
jgi:hypothetical protein